MHDYIACCRILQINILFYSNIGQSGRTALSLWDCGLLCCLFFLRVPFVVVVEVPLVFGGTVEVLLIFIGAFAELSSEAGQIPVLFLVVGRVGHAKHIHVGIGYIQTVTHGVNDLAVFLIQLQERNAVSAAEVLEKLAVFRFDHKATKGRVAEIAVVFLNLDGFILLHLQSPPDRL